MNWFWRRRRREAELDEEIKGHLAMAARDREARGESPREAAYAARREFGNATLVKEVTRTMWGGVWLEQLGQDLRLAARGLMRSPGFTTVVVLTLALGLGATAAMFGVLDRLLLRAPIAVREPSQVVRLYVKSSRPGPMFGRIRPEFVYPELDDFRPASSVAAVAFAEHAPFLAPAEDDAGAVKAWVTVVSGDYFRVLGVNPVLGRPLQPADDSVGSPAAAVVSYAWWRSRYGRSQSALRRVIRVKDRPYTVVGVAPPEFSGLSPREVDVWLPAAVAGNDLWGPVTKWFDWRQGNFVFDAIARLAPGRTRQYAAATLTLAYRHADALRPANPARPSDSSSTIVLGSIIPGRSAVEIGGLGGGSLSLSLLVGAVALIVCLIAVANVVNLFLLRSLGRRRETGIRLALGVGRWRLVRAILVESLLLAVLAAAVSVAVSTIGGRLLQALLFQEAWAAPLFGLRVFVFTALAAFAAGAITGLVPAFFSGRPDVLAALKAGIRLSSWRRSRLRAALVAGQVALTLVLLAGLGLFARSLQRAERIDFGADMSHLVMVSPMQSGAKLSAGDLDVLLQRVRSLPGVRGAAFAATAIPMFSFTVRPARAEGVDSLPNSTSGGGPYFSQIGPGYFDAVGLTVKRGRGFAPSEYATPATVALVSEEMALRLWPGQDALGKCLYVKVNPWGANEPACSVIVGIVENVRHDVSGPPLMQYYLPLPSDLAASYPEVVVRAGTDPDRLVAPLTALTKNVVPNLPDGAVRTIASILDRQLHTWKLASALLAMFAGLALLVSMVGLYSVVAFDAAQRRGEFGIRVALGARGLDLARLVLGQSLRYGTTGLLVGLALIVITGRFLAPQLFHTSPRDPLVLVSVAVVLLGGMVAASLATARSAVRVDPRASLQAD